MAGSWPAHARAGTVTRRRRTAVEALSEDVLDGEALLIAGIEWRPIEVEGRPGRAYYGVPWDDRAGSPHPPIRVYASRGTHGYFDPFPRPADLRGRDIEAELQWLQSAFAEELGRASEYFGRQPTLRWGLVVEQLL